MSHKLLWAAIALPLEVWVTWSVVRLGDPIVAGLLLVVIAFIAAAAAVKQVTPWGLVGNIIRYTVIGVLIGAGLIVSFVGLVIGFGRMWVSSIPWPLILLTTLIYIFPLTIVLALVQFLRVNMSIFWSVAGIAYVALLVLVLWQSNQ